MEVFKQRPAQRCDRAALCSELALRYPPLLLAPCKPPLSRCPLLRARPPVPTTSPTYLFSFFIFYWFSRTKALSCAKAALRRIVSRGAATVSPLRMQVQVTRTYGDVTRCVCRYSVTATAIRHIWDRRTWVWTNIPFWTKEETAESLAEGTCEACRGKVPAPLSLLSLSSLSRSLFEGTCEACRVHESTAIDTGAYTWCM
jgi:hypothetical protein